MAEAQAAATGLPAWRRWAWHASWLVAAAWVVLASERLVFVDYGDFGRAVSFMLAGPLDEHRLLWHFNQQGLRPQEAFSAVGYVFGVWGWLQKLTGGLYYDLRWHSLAAKCLLLLLAWQIARSATSHRNARRALCAALVVVAFAAHNSGMLKTFYGEYLVFLGMALAGWAVLMRHGPARTGLLCVAAFACGIAKTQYFYFPALLLGCLLLVRMQRPDVIGRNGVVGLLAVQAVCLLPALHNPHADYNHHSSTYFGSYMVLDGPERAALGLSPAQQACIGIDAWGHRAEGPGGTQVRYVGGTCFQKGAQTLADVLRPYWNSPSLVWRLPAFALPEHVTVRYFHVTRDLPYLHPVDRKKWGAARALVRITQWRERWITPLWPALVLAGLALAPMLRRREPRVAALALLLAGWFLSQVAVSLLGEGIRDLSKHLWAAQLGLDALVVLLVACGVGYLAAPTAGAWARARKIAAR